MLFTIGKTIFDIKSNNFSIQDYIMEITLIITSLLCLFGELVKLKGKIKDEFYYQEKAKYYNKAFKRMLVIAGIAYGIYLPLGIFKLNYLSPRWLINFLIYFLVFYAFARSRSQRVYFNYNIVEESNRVYYRGVFKNICYIGIIIALALGISLAVSLLINFSMAQLRTISIVYFFSFVSLSIEYSFFSYLEKSNFNQSQDAGISNAAILAKSLSLLLGVANAIIIFAPLHYIEKSIATGEFGISLGELTSKMLMLISYTSLLSLMLSIIGITYIYHDLKDTSPAPKTIRLAYLTCMLSFIISGILILLNNFVVLIHLLDPVNYPVIAFKICFLYRTTCWSYISGGII